MVCSVACVSSHEAIIILKFGSADWCNSGSYRDTDAPIPTDSVVVSHFHPEVRVWMGCEMVE